MTAMMLALDFRLGPAQEIVIAAGRPGQSDAKEMLNLIRSHFLPNAVVLFHRSGRAGKAIEKLVPFLTNQIPVDGKATAYVCQNYVCKRPVNDLNDLKKVLTDIAKQPVPVPF